MQPGFEFGVQRLMHRARALQPRLPGKRLGCHADPKMSLAARQTVALGMAGMPRTFILDLQCYGGECRLQRRANSTSSGCHKCDTLRLSGVANQAEESTLRT